MHFSQEGKNKPKQNSPTGTHHFLANHKFWQNLLYVGEIQFLFPQMDTFYLANCVCVCVRERERDREKERNSSKSINTHLNNTRTATIVTKLKRDATLKSA